MQKYKSFTKHLIFLKATTTVICKADGAKIEPKKVHLKEGTFAHPLQHPDRKNGWVTYSYVKSEEIG